MFTIIPEIKIKPSKAHLQRAISSIQKITPTVIEENRFQPN
jgi:hypothetical protein